MAKASNKKYVPKGVRLGWASLKEAKSSNVTVSLTSVKGIKITKVKSGSVPIKPIGNDNYLIP